MRGQCARTTFLFVKVFAVRVNLLWLDGYYIFIIQLCTGGQSVIEFAHGRVFSFLVVSSFSSVKDDA